MQIKHIQSFGHLVIDDWSINLDNENVLSINWRYWTYNHERTEPNAGICIYLSCAVYAQDLPETVTVGAWVKDDKHVGHIVYIDPSVAVTIREQLDDSRIKA